MELRDMHAYCIKDGTLEASSWQGQLCMVWTLEEIGGSLEIGDVMCAEAWRHASSSSLLGNGY